MKNISNSPSLRVIARPSFVEGMARVLDLGGTLGSGSRRATAEEADSQALSSDWLAVGQDIMNAMNQHEQENQEKNQ